MKKWLEQHQLLLSEQLSNSLLPHALLITGGIGAGKAELAHWLVGIIHCQNIQLLSPNSKIFTACQQCKACQLLKSSTYPDSKNIVAEKATIGVDDIRLANRFLEKKAHLGLFKTVLIPTAEKMTIAAGNALLKTLEEPAANNVIILLASQSELLLPTIISRCRLLNIRPPTGNNLFSDNGETENNAYINLTHLPELTDEKIKQQFFLFQQAYLSVLLTQKPAPDFLKQLLSVSDALRWLEKITVNLMRNNGQWTQALSIDEEIANNIKQQLDHDRLWHIYQSILQTNKQRQTFSQANGQFIIEKLLTEICR